MKNKLIIIIALVMSNAGFACEVCKAKQPKGFENLTHGEGPQGNIDYFNIHWDKVAHTNVHEALFICIIYSYLINPNFKYALFFICTIKMSFHIISQYHFTSHCSNVLFMVCSRK